MSAGVTADRSLLRFLRAHVPETALNDDCPPQEASLEPVALSQRLLAVLRTDATDAVVELLGQLQRVDLVALGRREEQIAFWLNLHNAVVLDASQRFAVRQSVRETPGFYRRAAYRVGGLRFSAEAIEQGILRGNAPPPRGLPQVFAPDDPRQQYAIAPLDPRIHYALNCATRSCPPTSVYSAEYLDAELDGAARGFVNSGGMDWEVSTGQALLSPLFESYRDDFGGLAGLTAVAARFWGDAATRDALITAIAAGRVRYLPWDWSLPAEESCKCE